MRICLLVFACSLLLGALGGAHPEPGTPESQGAAAPRDRVDFARQIQPILQARCQPCHFPGGKVYAAMPFDRAETVVRLREKLFTRLKDERDRQPIRAFLAEHPAPGAPAR